MGSAVNVPTAPGDHNGGEFLFDLMASEGVRRMSAQFPEWMWRLLSAENRIGATMRPWETDRRRRRHLFLLFWGLIGTISPRSVLTRFRVRRGPRKPSTGWPFHLCITSSWLQDKSSALAWLGQGRPSQSGTFVLKSTGGLAQVEWSPWTYQ